MGGGVHLGHMGGTHPPIARAIYRGKQIKGVQHQGGMGGRMGGVGAMHPPIPPGGYDPVYRISESTKSGLYSEKSVS